MDDRKRYVGLGLSLGLAVALAGCMSMGRPLPESASRPTTDRARPLAKSDDVPLVPVPPPPYGRRDEGNPASLGKPTPEATPKEIPVSAKANPAPEPKPVPAKPVSAASGTPMTAKQLVADAQKEYAGIDSYIVRLTRREVVGTKQSPEEVMAFKFRKQPWSVYFKWLSKEGMGREVVLVRGKYEGKLHTLLAAGDVPFVPAGRRMALDPDNVLVRNSTRHPITSAGIGAGVERLAGVLAAMERGDNKQGVLQLVGPVERTEFDRPAYGLEHVLPAGLDPSLPKGGRRLYFFHPENRLPTLIVAKDERGREVEYYFHDRLLPNVKLDDDDFDPDRLWKKAPAK